MLADGGTVLVSDHRGETVRLPGARHLSVTDGTVTEEASPGGAAVAVVELAVPAAGLAAAVARLRADGHQILRVREHAVPPPATHPVPAPAGPSGTGGSGGASAAGSPDQAGAEAGDSARPGPAPEVAR